MFKKMLHSKIHRATITHADINYEGSITLSPELLEAADLAEFEAVNIWNVTNGNRFETYTICGEKGSGDIAINGAAARLVTPGDIIIIASFSFLTEEESRSHKPKVIFVDQHNKIRQIRPENPGPKLTLA